MEIDDLSWNQPKETQIRAIEYFSVLPKNELYILLQPNGKDLWQNAAISLIKAGIENNKHLLPGMLLWLKDTNWPGASEIMKYLSSLGEATIKADLSNAINSALIEEDTDWVLFLKQFCAQYAMDFEKYVSKANYEYYVALSAKGERNGP